MIALDLIHVDTLLLETFPEPDSRTPYSLS